MFRKLLLSSVALAALTGTALAADLPSQAPPPVYVPPPPIFTWTGFYLGINGGGAEGNTHFDFNNLGVTTSGHEFGGGFIGGTAGYDWSTPWGGVGGGGLVFGVLVDADWADLTNGFNCAGVLGFSCDARVNFLGSARGRVGIGWEHALLYVSGGLGVGNARFSVTDNLTGFSAVDNVTRIGFTVGGGIEYAITPNWAAKVEYLLYDFENSHSGFLFPATGFGVLDNTNVSTTTLIHTVRFGIDYRFLPPPPPPPAPIIAKY
jgi:outer membrane immunogenic protein